jgi:two-component system KDP operon response regulator KdpE
MTGPRLLIIDDDPAILLAVRRGLEGHDYRVDQLSEGGAVLETIRRIHPDVVLLDLVLPDADGIDLCRAIRAESAVPIIVLSALGDDPRKVRALDEGADDYVVKPFSMAELEARIRAALRRTTVSASAVLTAGSIALDVTKRRLSVLGEEVHLTPREYDLLRLLLSQPGRVLTQRHLLSAIWGPEYQDDAHILRTFIHQLRAKLSAIDPGAAALIVNDPGVGYRVEVQKS